MKRTIGILGGISPASTLEYYRSIISMYYERAHDYYYPEIVIKSLDFGRYTDLEDEGRFDEYASYISETIEALAAAGAEFAIMAANSAHSAYDRVHARSPIPMISIVDAAARQAARLGLGKVLLTGIKYTMGGDFYQNGFAKAGIKVIVPSQDHQNEINRIIFEELALEKFEAASRKWFLDMTDEYDVDGVILGCTELPLLVGTPPAGRPFLDTLHLHVAEALEYCLS